ncbi:MAG: hypothetical protein ACR2HM_05795 [Acidimicrobiales bacterium]
MGEIFHALEVLNRTMKLGLEPTEILRAEMGFKSALALQGNPNPTLPEDPVALAQGYELVAELRPRAEALSLGQLSTLAKREMAKPRTRVNARTLKQIDKALTATVPEKVPSAPARTATAAKKAGTKKAATKKAPAKK